MPNVPFIGFSVKAWIILTIFSQNSSFFEVLHELIESIWKEFWAKIPVLGGKCIKKWGQNVSKNGKFCKKRGKLKKRTLGLNVQSSDSPKIWLTFAY